MRAAKVLCITFPAVVLHGRALLRQSSLWGADRRGGPTDAPPTVSWSGVLRRRRLSPVTVEDWGGRGGDGGDPDGSQRRPPGHQGHLPSRALSTAPVILSMGACTLRPRRRPMCPANISVALTAKSPAPAGHGLSVQYCARLRSFISRRASHHASAPAPSSPAREPSRCIRRFLIPCPINASSVSRSRSTPNDATAPPRNGRGASVLTSEGSSCNMSSAVCASSSANRLVPGVCDDQTTPNGRPPRLAAQDGSLQARYRRTYRACWLGRGKGLDVITKAPKRLHIVVLGKSPVCGAQGDPL